MFIQAQAQEKYNCIWRKQAKSKLKSKLDLGCGLELNKLRIRWAWAWLPQGWPELKLSDQTSPHLQIWHMKTDCLQISSIRATQLQTWISYTWGHETLDQYQANWWNFKKVIPGYQSKQGYCTAPTWITGENSNRKWAVIQSQTIIIVITLFILSLLWNWVVHLDRDTRRKQMPVPSPS